MDIMTTMALIQGGVSVLSGIVNTSSAVNSSYNNLKLNNLNTAVNRIDAINNNEIANLQLQEIDSLYNYNNSEIDKEIASLNINYQESLRQYDYDSWQFLDTQKAGARNSRVNITSGTARAYVNENKSRLAGDRQAIANNYNSNLESLNSAKTQNKESAELQKQIIQAGILSQEEIDKLYPEPEGQEDESNFIEEVADNDLGGSLGGLAGSIVGSIVGGPIGTAVGGFVGNGLGRLAEEGIGAFGDWTGWW